MHVSIFKIDRLFCILRLTKRRYFLYLSSTDIILSLGSKELLVAEGEIYANGKYCVIVQSKEYRVTFDVSECPIKVEPFASLPSCSINFPKNFWHKDKFNFNAKVSIFCFQITNTLFISSMANNTLQKSNSHVI